MSFWVKEKSFYQKMAAIAIPLALQNLINVGVGRGGYERFLAWKSDRVHLSDYELGADRRGRGTDQPILGAEGFGFHPQGHEYGL